MERNEEEKNWKTNYCGLAWSIWNFVRAFFLCINGFICMRTLKCAIWLWSELSYFLFYAARVRAVDGKSITRAIFNEAK